MAAYTKFQPAHVNSIQICCVSLNRADRIRLIALPPQMIPVIRIAIQKGWGLPIQQEQDYYGTYEFKLTGNPWYGSGEDAVKSRRLIASILMAMARNGWILICSADMSKSQADKDTLFFENALPDPACQIFSTSFNMTDRIRVIDAPAMMPYVKQAVASHWPNGIQEERAYFGSLELKLNGKPWAPSSYETVYSRLVLAQIIANFKSIGFKLYGSIDLSVGGGGMDLDSLFFRKVGPSWQ